MNPDDNAASEPPRTADRTRVPFLLHDVEVRPASNEIVVEGAVVRVKPRLMDVLLRLAAAPGDVVPRETLLADAWPRRMVNDDVLSRAIADLRIALGDDAREARFIETLPKVGYRLIAPVAPVAPAAPRKGPGTGDTAPAARVAPVAWRRWAAALAIALVPLLANFVPRAASGVPDRDELTRQLAQAEPFASDRALEVGPRFSPDGRDVAYAVGEGRSARIVIRGVRSNATATIGDPAHLNLSPVYFPDGKRIAYMRRTESGDCAIVAHDLATGDVQPLVDCARRPQDRFDIAPDGRRLVYVGVIRPQYPAGLILRDLATGADTTLTAPEPGLGDDQFPRFSPDGARIAFFRGTRSHRDLYALDVAGAANPRDLGSPRGLAYGAAWLGPNGPLLVAADWFGQRALNVFDPAMRTAATVGARGARFPDVDRAGNIVFENAVYSANLFLLDPAHADARPRELWPSTRYTNQPQFSPDGTRVLFVSNRDGASGLFVATLDGDAKRLQLPDAFVYLRPHWSLDGTAIYAVRSSRRDDGGRVQQAIRVALADGQAQVLTALGDAVFDVREADGGRSLIVGEITGNAARVLRVPAAGGAAERLPLPLAGEYQVDGHRIAIAQPDLPGLTLCDMATIECEQLAVPITDVNRYDWLLAGDALWFRTAGTPDELVRYDVKRRAIEWRSAFVPTAFGLSLAVRADGRALLVAREAPPAIDLMYAPRAAR
ncbi:MAG: winged helix-turn-helix domain-containing protein [Burkholderiales bacterium]